MADYKEILYEKQRGGALITLNRPEAMNAISRSMIKELHQALDEVEADREVSAVVLTGALASASAQQYPTRPITLVVPLPPGGTNDIMARGVAPEWKKVVQQTGIKFE